MRVVRRRLRIQTVPRRVVLGLAVLALALVFHGRLFVVLGEAIKWPFYQVVVELEQNQFALRKSES